MTAHLTTAAPGCEASVRTCPPGSTMPSRAGLRRSRRTGGRRWRSLVRRCRAPCRRRGDPGGAPTRRMSGDGACGTYEVGESLGAGRLGSEVFRGVHRALGHPVAIRILRPARRTGRRRASGFCTRPDRCRSPIRRSSRSATTAKKTDFVYLVTDFIDGRSMRQLLQDRGRAAVGSASSAARAAARGGARAAPPQDPAVRLESRDHADPASRSPAIRMPPRKVSG